MKRTICILAALLTTCAALAQTPEERAAQIVSRLTLEQKASLMWHTSAPVEKLGIPPYNWWNEALHGVARNGKATTFPMPIALAATFDDQLVQEIFTAASDEGRVKNRQALEHGHAGHYSGITFWTPNINIFRDPRWGRGMETYGEDPYLTGRMGMAVVQGLQGPLDSPVLKAHACAKHFAVHSGPEWSRHTFNAEISERDLRETYLPAFKDLVTKAGVQEVMIAYNRFRGVPCGANDYLINTILRGEWGFKGLVVSDCWAVADIYKPGYHEYSPDAATAVAATVHTGTDLECGSAYDRIPEAVRRGLLDEADVDRSLVRILAARIRLGELDGISLWNDLPDNIVEGPAHRALALDAARESIVLLQTRKSILPLKSGARIALVGPNADDAEMQWGNYNPIPDNTVTLLEALKARVPDLIYERGCGIAGPEYMPESSPFASLAGQTEEQLQEVAKQYAIGVQDIKAYIARDEEQRRSFLPEPDAASLLAKLEGVDIVIFAGGISPRFEGEEMPVDVPGFRGGDRTSIELPEAQRSLIKALHDAGKKVILVNFSGSAMGLVPEALNCDAILQAWYPGQEGGTAIADVLFGDVNPSGKLPVTFYCNVEQLPDYENYDMRGRTYRYFAGKPLFAFGHGLSYTRFRFGRARVKDGKLVVPVRNCGKCAGTATVQLYTRRPADIAGPLKSLRGFKRVNIPAGKKCVVEFPLDDEVFLSWSEDAGNMVPMKGEWELLYGGSSDKLRRCKFNNR